MLLIPVIYTFTRLDWHEMLTEGRFKWLEVRGSNGGRRHGS